MALMWDDFKSVLEQITVYERYFIAKCVFHDDSKPSMMVFKDGFFRCLGCNRAGTWKTLWNKVKGQPIKIQPEVKTDWKGPDLEGHDGYEIAYTAYDYLAEFPSLGWYLEMRGLDGRIEPAMLGYWNGWYTIPIFDRERNFLNVVYRAAPHIQAYSGMRYWYHGAPHLYVPDWKLVEDSKYIVITYGILDALTLADLRIPAATPSNGKDSFRSEWMDDIRKVTYIVPDQGEEESARHHAKELGWRGNVVYMDWHDGLKDINDLHVAGYDKDIINTLMER